MRASRGTLLDQSRQLADVVTQRASLSSSAIALNFSGPFSSRARSHNSRMGREGRWRKRNRFWLRPPNLEPRHAVRIVRPLLTFVKAHNVLVKVSLVILAVLVIGFLSMRACLSRSP